MSSLRIMRLMSNVGWSMPAPTMTRMPPRAQLAEPRLDGGAVPRALEHDVGGARRHALGLPGREHLEVGRVDDRGHPEVGGQLAASLVRLHHGDVVDPHRLERGDAQRPDRARRRRP